MEKKPADARLMKIQPDRPLVLASGSPRRRQLLEQAGYVFTVRRYEADEDFAPDMPPEKVASFLAAKKASHFREGIGDEIIITADTVVILDNQVLNKPADSVDAVRMLEALSGRTHTVMTGVCIVSREKERLFDDTTLVTFRKLTHAEIDYYVEHFKPFDKAGAYGAQDWIGLTGVEKISGSYFNVMGLPVHRVYENLLAWV
ncbi:MAG TPA: Maf family nucleotide pyrophosphatase [Cyclobacteriaceae bacterium]|jgi:septum formation protein